MKKMIIILMGLMFLTTGCETTSTSTSNSMGKPPSDTTWESMRLDEQYYIHRVEEPYDKILEIANFYSCSFGHEITAEELREINELEGEEEPEPGEYILIP